MGDGGNRDGSDTSTVHLNTSLLLPPSSSSPSPPPPPPRASFIVQIPLLLLPERHRFSSPTCMAFLLVLLISALPLASVVIGKIKSLRLGGEVRNHGRNYDRRACATGRKSAIHSLRSCPVIHHLLPMRRGESVSTKKGDASSGEVNQECAKDVLVVFFFPFFPRATCQQFSLSGQAERSGLGQLFWFPSLNSTYCSFAKTGTTSRAFYLAQELNLPRCDNQDYM